MTSTINVIRECVFCGQTFMAKTTFTQYCSKTCNNRDYKKKKRIEKIDQSDDKFIRNQRVKLQLIEAKSFLKISELGLLLGLSRGSIYKLIHSGILPIIKVGSRTLIEKSVIQEVFKSNKLVTKTTSEAFEPISEFYTTNDIEDKYGIKYGYLYQLIRKYRIPFTNHASRLIVSKIHFDRFMDKRNHKIDSVQDYVKVRDLMIEYGLNRDQVYRRIRSYKIPSKKVGGIHFICKKSFDEVLKPLI